MLDDNEPATFFGDVDIRMGGGNDLVDIQADTVINGDLDIKLGGGLDDLLFSPMVTVDGQGNINGGGGSDTIAADYAFASWGMGLPDLMSIENIV